MVIAFTQNMKHTERFRP